MADADFSAEQAREKFSYDPTTGVLSRVDSRRCPKVGTLDTKGYVQLRVIAGKKVMAHRLIWLYMTGAWPERQIDHINGVKTDNRWANLRQVTPSENCQNKPRARSDSQNGLMGVRKTAKKNGRWNGKWCARIAVPGGKRISLKGSYATPEEAHAVYLEAKRRLHAGCTI